MKHVQIFGGDECDQIGRVLKFLETTFLAKEAQMIGNFLGYFEKPHSYVKTALATFWATFGKNWTTFSPTSGHTGADLEEAQTHFLGKKREREGASQNILTIV